VQSVFTKACHWTLSWGSWTQSQPSQPTFLRPMQKCFYFRCSRLIFWILYMTTKGGKVELSLCSSMKGVERGGGTAPRILNLRIRQITLPPAKKKVFIVCTECWVAPEPVWAWWQGEKSTAENRTPVIQHVASQRTATSCSMLLYQPRIG
jgi:hypothetical protein